MDEAQRQNANLREKIAPLEKIREVLAPENQPQVDETEAFLDTYLQAALEGEKSGNPIPLTANLAVQMHKLMKEVKALTGRNEELQKQVKLTSDPVVTADRQTFANLDSHIATELDNMFGRENVTPQKFTQVASEITEEVRRLQRDTPEIWDEIRRKPGHQLAMVKHFVARSVPQKARQVMEHSALQAKEFTRDELILALKEARENIQDPKERSKVIEKIRQELLSSIYGEGRNRRRAR